MIDAIARVFSFKKVSIYNGEESTQKLNDILSMYPLRDDEFIPEIIIPPQQSNSLW